MARLQPHRQHPCFRRQRTGLPEDLRQKDPICAHVWRRWLRRRIRNRVTSGLRAEHDAWDTGVTRPSPVTVTTTTTFDTLRYAARRELYSGNGRARRRHRSTCTISCCPGEYPSHRCPIASHGPSAATTTQLTSDISQLRY